MCVHENDFLLNFLMSQHGVSAQAFVACELYFFVKSKVI